MANQFDAETGEIIEQPTALTLIDNSALASLAKAEIDQQVATARQYPRSVARAVANITELACLDEETAISCCYELKRKKDGKDNKIDGPSIRLAEIAYTQWGNCRVGARVVEINRREKYVAAEGIFHDLETNAAVSKTVRRRISTSKGGIFGDDMIAVTSNAACSIAMRNAILAGIPRGVYGKAYEKARSVAAGTMETLADNRTKAIAAFKGYGVTPAQIFEALEVEGEDDIKLRHIASMRAMYSTLKNNEATVEEMFGKPEPDHKVVENPLADEPAKETDASPQRDRGDAPEAAGGTADERSLHQQEPSAAETFDQKDNSPSDMSDGKFTVENAAAADANPWFEKGAEAARNGMSLRAIPPEIRAPERADDAQAWRSGHASVVKAESGQ